MNRRDFLESRVSYCSRQFSFLVAIRLKQPTFNEDGPGSRRGVSGTSVVLKRLGEEQQMICRPPTRSSWNPRFMSGTCQAR